MNHWPGRQRRHAWWPKDGTAAEGSSLRPSPWHKVHVQYKCLGSRETDSCVVPDAVRLTLPPGHVPVVCAGGLCRIRVLLGCVSELIIIFIYYLLCARPPIPFLILKQCSELEVIIPVSQVKKTKAQRGEGIWRLAGRQVVRPDSAAPA